MIYVQEKDFGRQIDLLNFLIEQDSYSICAWLYPESTANSVATHAVTQSELEPVTSYGDGTLPKHTNLVPCSSDTLQAFTAAQTEVTKNCDSLALYKTNNSSWSAVTVGHEGMCLVRNESLLQQLIAAGFSASTEAPSWW